MMAIHFILVILMMLLPTHFASSRNISSWLTSCDAVDGSVLALLEIQAPPSSTELQPDLNFIDAEIKIDTNIHKQSIVGYGAGMPQSSAVVLKRLKDANVELYQEVMLRLFGSSNESSAFRARISVLRFPIGSCDFSLVNTSLDEVPGDVQLEKFALDADSEIIAEILLDALRINPKITLIGSPWSPPSWLRTIPSLIPYSEKNTLKDSDEIIEIYANYFLRTVQAFNDRGLSIAYLTLQNEPLFGTSDQYPGMFLSAELSSRLAVAVKKLLGPRGVKLLAYDHNWDHPEYPIDVIKSTSEQSPSPTIEGVAWHCYGGDMAAAQELLHELFPSVPQLVTECTGAFPNDTCDISRGMDGFGFNHEWDMAHILLGAAAHWAASGVKWILALDENCGPTLPKVTFKCGRPLVSIPSSAVTMQDLRFNQDFWSVAHMSAFIEPASVRVDTSTSLPQQLIAESFLDSSGTTTLIVHNLNHTTSVSITVRLASDSAMRFTSISPPFSTKIFQWK